MHNFATITLQFNLYSKHVALSGSGTWAYVSLLWLMVLVIYKTATLLIVCGYLSTKEFAYGIFLLLQYFSRHNLFRTTDTN